MVEIGQPAPDFTLPDQSGRELTLSQWRGSPVVLYFYPKDDTPGCTKEACAFRDAFGEYLAQGAKILGVSPDGVDSHARFARKFTLPFTLLADPDRTVCQAYGVWKEKTLYGRKSVGVIRSTFVVGPDGRIEHAWYNVRADGHASKVLEAVNR